MGRVTLQLQTTPARYGLSYYQIPYTYDLAGNTLTASDGYSHIESFTYNSAGRLLSMSSSGSTPTSILSSMHYNAFGLLTAETLGDSETNAYTFDKRARAERIPL